MHDHIQDNLVALFFASGVVVLDDVFGLEFFEVFDFDHGLIFFEGTEDDFFDGPDFATLLFSDFVDFGEGAGTQFFNNLEVVFDALNIGAAVKMHVMYYINLSKALE